VDRAWNSSDANYLLCLASAMIDGHFPALDPMDVPFASNPLSYVPKARLAASIGNSDRFESALGTRDTKRAVCAADRPATRPKRNYASDGISQHSLAWQGKDFHADNGVTNGRLSLTKLHTSSPARPTAYDFTSPRRLEGSRLGPRFWNACQSLAFIKRCHCSRTIVSFRLQI